MGFDIRGRRRDAFPTERAAIDSYWQRMVAVCEHTVAVDLAALSRGLRGPTRP